MDAREQVVLDSLSELTISQHRDLCEVCATIDFDALWSSKRLDDDTRVQKSRVLGTNSDIAVRAKSCIFCFWLWTNYTFHRDEADPAQTDGLSRTVKLTVYGSTMYNGIEKRRETVKGHLIPIVELTSQDVGEDTVQEHAHIRLVDLAYTTGGPKNKSTSSILDSTTTAIRQFSLWLRECEAKEHAHNLDEAGHENRVPLDGFQLINVETMQVERIWEAVPYLALSYVWGTNKAIAISPNGRLERPLPATLQDSLVLAQGLEYQYLWVDAVCIPQDQPGVRKQQIECMNEIYQRASATIIATGPDVNHGLYGISRSYNAHRSLQIGSVVLEYQQLPWNNLMATHGEVHPIFSPWSTRGWTFQEALMSRRRLIFTDSRYLYECDDNSRQTHPTDFHEQVRAGFFNDLKTIKSDAMKDWNMHWYCCLLNAYLKRKLSYERDILSAFTGISQIVAKIVPDRWQCWRIPQRSFMAALMWAPTKHVDVVHKRTQRLDDGRFVPSWHWASLKLPKGIAFVQGSEPLQLHSRAHRYTSQWDDDQWTHVGVHGLLPFDGQVKVFDDITAHRGTFTDPEHHEANMKSPPLDPSVPGSIIVDPYRLMIDDLPPRLDAGDLFNHSCGMYITCDAWAFASTNSDVTEPMTVYPYAQRLGKPSPMEENKQFILLVSEETDQEKELRESWLQKYNKLAIGQKWQREEHDIKGHGASRKVYKRVGWAVVDIKEWEAAEPVGFAAWLG